MTRNAKIFLIVSLVSLICLWGLNLIQKDLEDVFYWSEIGKDPDLLLYQANALPVVEKISQSQEVAPEEIEEPEINADSAFSNIALA